MLFSLDETSFGIEDLRRYGWGKIGKKVSHKFSAMQALKLFCCISSTGVVAYKFCKGGTNNLIFRDFLENVYSSLLFNHDNKKVIIILDNWPPHKSHFVKEVVLKSSMRLIFGLTHNSRSNPIEYFFGHLKGKLKDEPYKNFQ